VIIWNHIKLDFYSYSAGSRINGWTNSRQSKVEVGKILLLTHVNFCVDDDDDDGGRRAMLDSIKRTKSWRIMGSKCLFHERRRGDGINARWVPKPNSFWSTAGSRTFTIPFTPPTLSSRPSTLATKGKHHTLVILSRVGQRQSRKKYLTFPKTLSRL